MVNETTPSLTNTPRVALARTEDLDPSSVTTEEVYTSGIPGGLDDENLIQVNVSVSQATGSAITNPASGRLNNSYSQGM